MSQNPATDRDIITRLWRDYVRPQWRTLTLAIFFMVIVACATAAYTALFKLIVDTMGTGGVTPDIANTDSAPIALNQAKQFVRLVAPAVIGITFVSGVSLFLQSVLSNKISLNVVGRLQKSMFASLQAMDFGPLSRRPVGEYVSHFTNDVNVVASALLRTMSNLIRETLTLVLLIGAMLYYNWQLSLIILIIYPLAFWPIIYISKRIRGSSHAAQSHMGTINAMLNESLSGTRMIRSYGLEEQEKARLGSAFDRRIQLFLSVVTNKARVDPILEVLAGLAIAFGLAFGVYQLYTNATTPGALVAVLSSLALAAPRARALGTLNNVIQEGLAALHRIFALIDLMPTIISGTKTPSLTGQIEFENVQFSYQNSAPSEANEITNQALNNINFTIPSGQTIALVGPSGGGKSTVLNLLIRLYDTSAGQITVDGHDIKSLDTACLRQQIALVSQDTTIFDDTVYNNIAMGKISGKTGGQIKVDRAEIIAAAKAAHADEFIQALPNGYDTILGEDGGTLSGGQKQRISLARAFLKDAPILLLDEATSALDAKSESLIQQSLDKLCAGRTVIVIAHRLSTVRRADQILVLDKGTIVERGNHEQLMQVDGLYARLRSLQFSE